MRETVIVQVGQCGNQVGNSFWSQLLKEHEKTPDEDESLSAYFRFSSQRDGTRSMKARALLIDMECGPLQETMRSTLGSLFEETQYVMDVSGSGNNFAHGHYMYGPQYRPKFEECLRRISEQCDSLQTFIVIHSLGGGTGSGVGTYVLGLLSDVFPTVSRLSTCVYPSEDDNVVTSPYNSILASREIVRHCHCAIPLDNTALQAFTQLEANQLQNQQTRSGLNSQRSIGSASDDSTAHGRGKAERRRGYAEMNGVAGRVLSQLTASARFSGQMNVDMNEICTNLVPFPRMPFLAAALSPFRAISNTAPMRAGGLISKSRRAPLDRDGARTLVQRAFHDLLGASGQVSAATPPARSYGGVVTLASAFLGRGESLPLDAFLNSVGTAKRELTFPYWNSDACKIGLCSESPPNQSISVMALYNSTGFASVLQRERGRFNQLYRRKAMLHHYTEFVDEFTVGEADKEIDDVIQAYQSLEAQTINRPPPKDVFGRNETDPLFSRLFPAF